MKKYFLLFLLILGALPARAEEAASWYVPPAHFNAALQVMNGYANIIALFPNATASFSYDDAGKSISHLRVALDAGNLITGNAETQGALAGLLGAAQYPEIRITAPDSVEFKDGKAELKATLTMHGASKPVTLEAVLNNVGKTTTNNGLWSHKEDAVGLSLHAAIKRADFAMGDDPDAAQPARFGDTMTLQLEMQAMKQ